jgi:hypothetical protein
MWRVKEQDEQHGVFYGASPSQAGLAYRNCVSPFRFVKPQLPICLTLSHATKNLQAGLSTFQYSTMFRRCCQILPRARYTLRAPSGRPQDVKRGTGPWAGPRHIHLGTPAPSGRSGRSHVRRAVRAVRTTGKGGVAPRPKFRPIWTPVARLRATLRAGGACGAWPTARLAMPALNIKIRKAHLWFIQHAGGAESEFEFDSVRHLEGTTGRRAPGKDYMRGLDLIQLQW